MRARPLHLVAVSALFLALAACTGQPVPRPSGTVGPTQAPTTVPEPSASPVAPGKASLAVYYAGDNRGRIVLYREFHTLPVSLDSPAARVKAAVAEMLGKTAKDPDYRTLWPAGAHVGNVTASGDTVTVDIAGASKNSVGAEASAQAVQQLVWTATAASGLPKVVITLDGKPATDLWGHADISAPVQRAAASNVLASVWLISPQQGDTVGKTFTVHLAGIVFEAEAHLTIRQNGEIKADQPVLLSGGAPAQGEAKLTFTLEPGTYEIQAFDISAKDGKAVDIDNHVITVA